jgi:hypothetical protein
MEHPRLPCTSSRSFSRSSFSGFFAGSETALVSLGRIDLQAMREQGDRPRRDDPHLQAPTRRGCSRSS